MIVTWSFRLLVCSCLLWTLAVVEGENASYSLIFPEYIERGKSMPVTVTFWNASAPVSLRIELMDSDGIRMQKGQSRTFNGKGSYTVNFQVSENLRWSRYTYLHVVAWGGVEFMGFHLLQVRKEKFTIMVQTDKSEYKLGQTVRFRALILDADGSVSKNPMQITITDPFFNRIGQWSREEVDENGPAVFEGKMATSTDAHLGMWRIEAIADKWSTVKTFTLAEYAEPGYLVKVYFPSVSSVSTEKVTGKIVAAYTSGFPVDGTVKIVAKMIYYYPRSQVLVKNATLVHGVAKVKFTIEELEDLGFKTYANGRNYARYQFRLYYRSFNFTAHVTNNLTGEVVTGSDVTRFLSYTSYVRFIFPTPYRFKPDLPMAIYMQVTGSRGFKITDPKDISINITASYHRPRRSGEPYTTYSRYYRPPTYVQETLCKDTVKTNSDGIAVLRIRKVPATATKMFFTVTDGLHRTYRTMYRFSSPSQTYLTFKVLKKENRVGRFSKFVLMSNKPLGDCIYQVYSKGMLLVNDPPSKASEKSKEGTITIKLTKQMVPVADLIALCKVESGEIIADKLELEVELPENKLELKFAAGKVKPGEDATLIASAPRRSTVFLSGWDKLGRKSTNDVGYSAVQAALKRMSRLYTSYYNYISDTDDVLRYCGLDIITDATVAGKYSYFNAPRPYRYGYSYPYYRYSRYRPTPPSPGPPGRSVKKPLTSGDLMKKHLPETALWDVIELGHNTKGKLKFKTPDRITKLTVSGFSVSPTMGIAVAEEHAKMETSQRLFITTDLPRTAQRGEVVCFHAFIYNYDEDNKTLVINVNKDPSSFLNVVVKNISGTITEVDKSIRFNERLGVLPAGHVMAFPICIKPVKLGDVDVNVRVKSNKASDSIVSTINIKAEGVPHFINYPVLIEIDSQKGFSKMLDITLPDDAVEGSVKVHVDITGDVMGMVANHLDDLLQLPSGSGEQNMLYFTPHAYFLNYLKQTGRLHQSIVAKTKNVMMAAYQRELTYQRYDGSFSSFGNRDESGNMWLTAYVVKSFVQAVGMNVIVIERDVINRAIGFVTQYQNADGSFREMGQNIHPELQGEKVGLTAFVVIALIEANYTMSDELYKATLYRTRDALSLAIPYLESQVANMKKDSYEICILAYALSMAGSSKAAQAISKMNQGVVTADDAQYWSSSSKPLSIEMTSYALMALKKSGSPNVMAVHRWLVRQMGPTGGFISAQATSLAVQALATMTELAYGATVPPFEAWLWNRESEPVSVTFNSSTVLHLQKRNIPAKKGEYPTQFMLLANSEVSGNKSSFAFFQLVVSYNLASKSDAKFSSNSTMIRNNSLAFLLKTCVNSTQGDSIIITEIEVPTGYRVIKTSSKYGKAVGLDFNNEKVVLYHYGSELQSAGDCSLLQMISGMVAHAKPRGLRMFDLDNSDSEYISKYSVPDGGVCNVSYQKGCKPPS